MKLLILEDDGSRVRFFIERFHKHDLTITENAQEAVYYLKNKVFDYIFLDNDLGPDNGEGKDVAKFLFNNVTNLNNRAIIIIHSWNRPATDAIKSWLPNAVAAPFNTGDFFNLRLDI